MLPYLIDVIFSCHFFTALRQKHPAKSRVLLFFSHRAAPPEPVGSGVAGSDRRPPFARAQFPAFLSLPREGFFSCRASRGSGPAQPGAGCRRRLAFASAARQPPDFRSPLGASHFHERNKTSVILLRSSRIKKQGLERTQDKIMVLLSFAEPLCVAPLPCHLILYAPYGPIISDILRHVKHHGAHLAV